MTFLIVVAVALAAYMLGRHDKHVRRHHDTEFAKGWKEGYAAHGVQHDSGKLPGYVRMYHVDAPEGSE